MEPELPKERVLGFLCADRAVLGSPSLLPGRERDVDSHWAYEAKKHGDTRTCSQVAQPQDAPSKSRFESERSLC